jgi:hypothetical protein
VTGSAANPASLRAGSRCASSARTSAHRSTISAGSAPAGPRSTILDDYSASQALGRALRAERAWGIAYESVRREGGECAAVFRPRALSPCKIAEHLEYLWDGERTAEVFTKRRIVNRGR